MRDAMHNPEAWEDDQPERPFTHNYEVDYDGDDDEADARALDAYQREQGIDAYQRWYRNALALLASHWSPHGYGERASVLGLSPRQAADLVKLGYVEAAEDPILILTQAGRDALNQNAPKDAS